MTAKLRVYLAGPIRGCNQEQRTWWRTEVKSRLEREFDFEDPTLWPKEGVVIPKEVPSIEDCDIVLANMWKESIGTTLGIARARHQGKPVILIDSNRINNDILTALVHPEVPVHSLDEACARLRQLAAEFKTIVVEKNPGEKEDFDPRKLAGSVSAAAAAAGKSDVGFEERVSGPVVARVRRDGGPFGSITTEQIRVAVSDQLESMKFDQMLSKDLRSRAAAVLEAWNEREKIKRGADAIRECEERARRAELEAENWKKLLSDLRGQPIPSADPTDKLVVTGPRFATMDKMLSEVAKKWKAFLVFHDDANLTARRVKPALSPRSLEDLYALLERLGEFARDRAYAGIDASSSPDFQEKFGAAYAPTETEATKKRYRKPEYAFRGRNFFGLQHLKMTDERGRKIRVYFDELSRTQFLVCAIGHRETYGFNG